MELNQVATLVTKLGKFSLGEQQIISFDEALTPKNINSIKTLMRQHFMFFTIRRKKLMPMAEYLFTRIE